MSSQPNFERIRDEVHRQVSLCKCSKQYHVLQVSERHFRVFFSINLIFFLIKIDFSLEILKNLD